MEPIKLVIIFINLTLFTAFCFVGYSFRKKRENEGVSLFRNVNNLCLFCFFIFSEIFLLFVILDSTKSFGPFFFIPTVPTFVGSCWIKRKIYRGLIEKAKESKDEADLKVVVSSLERAIDGQHTK